MAQWRCGAVPVNIQAPINHTTSLVLFQRCTSGYSGLMMPNSTFLRPIAATGTAFSKEALKAAINALPENSVHTEVVSDSGLLAAMKSLTAVGPNASRVSATSVKTLKNLLRQPPRALCSVAPALAAALDAARKAFHSHAKTVNETTNPFGSAVPLGGQLTWPVNVPLPSRLPDLKVSGHTVHAGRREGCARMHGVCASASACATCADPKTSPSSHA